VEQPSISLPISQSKDHRARMSKRSPRSEQEALVALLRDIRHEAGLRQTDLAERLGQPQPFVSRYESGERRLDILELRQVCRAVGITLQEFAARLEQLLK
jgi:ribosome-binding protein aMBF1 (putative translation factor)